MADTIETDLPTLKYVLHHGLGLRLNGLDSCVPEIRISPEVYAALLAGDFSGIGSVIAPTELCPAVLAVK